MVAKGNQLGEQIEVVMYMYEGLATSVRVIETSKY